MSCIDSSSSSSSSPSPPSSSSQFNHHNNNNNNNNNQSSSSCHEKEWKCEKCTFLNSSWLFQEQCQMCNAPRLPLSLPTRSMSRPSQDDLTTTTAVGCIHSLKSNRRDRGRLHHPADEIIDLTAENTCSEDDRWVCPTTANRSHAATTVIDTTTSDSTPRNDTTRTSWNENIKWPCASTESARKRKRKLPSNNLGVMDDVVEVVRDNIHSARDNTYNNTNKKKKEEERNERKNLDHAAVEVILLDDDDNHEDDGSGHVHGRITGKKSLFLKSRDNTTSHDESIYNRNKTVKSKLSKDTHPSPLRMMSVSTMDHMDPDDWNPATTTTTTTSSRGTCTLPPQHDPIKTTVAKTHGPFSQARHEALMKQAQSKMKSIFGISSLRNLQPIAIESALKGQSQIIVMATGGGKSLCYQLPAVVLSGVTIVISPLIALMVDQVEQLKKKGVQAELICSSQSQKENQQVFQRLKDMVKMMTTKTPPKEGSPKEQNTLVSTKKEYKSLKLLYCTPELIQTAKFQDVLMGLYNVNMLSMIVIDEAHCMSTWGHDFRPAYRKLSWLRTSFPNVPCMACTATATKKVIEEIKQVLCFDNKDKVHMSTFNRSNIHYEVRYKDTMGDEDAMKDLVKTIRDQHGRCQKENAKCSGIVYVHKRQDTAMISSRLQLAGIVAAPYHAGLKDAERKRIQQDWTKGDIQVAIATVAFGMGIDLAHVRYVIHWTLSKSIEGFYQESGRAGRDGLPSLSIIYYSRDDASKFAFLIRKTQEKQVEKHGHKNTSTRDMDALNKMMEYCTSACCRRKYLLHHFGEEIDAKRLCRSTCDYCLDPQKVKDAMTSSSVSKAIRDVKQQRFGYIPGGGAHFENKDKYDDNDYARMYESMHHDGILYNDSYDEYEEQDHDASFLFGYNHLDIISPSAGVKSKVPNKKSNSLLQTVGFSTAGGNQISVMGNGKKDTNLSGRNSFMHSHHDNNNNFSNNKRSAILSKFEAMERGDTSLSQNTSRSKLWSKLNKQENELIQKELRQQQDHSHLQYCQLNHPSQFQNQQDQQRHQAASPKKSSHVTIPSHFYASKSNSNHHITERKLTESITPCAKTSPSSKDLGLAVDAVKLQLEEIQKKKDALLAKFNKKK